MGVFHVSLNCTNGTKSHKALHMKRVQTLKPSLYENINYIFWDTIKWYEKNS